MITAKSYNLKKLPKEIFRAYDIRGIINEEFDEDAYYSIGRAIACRLQQLSRPDIFIARDGRLTSDSLTKALSQGLLDSGVNVHDLGVVATPMMYFATYTQGIDCGLMVTGSHNPSEYNGVKMVLAGKTLANADIERLYQLNQSQDIIDGHGHYQSIDITPEYIQRIVKDISCDRPFKVVVDSGNGMAGPFAPKIIEALGCEVIPLYCDVDGRFPNHHPDPTIESNLSDLKKAVVDHQADIGLAFDGDADRLGVITNEGELIWPDRLMMLYAQDVLTRKKNATIVYDVKCSSLLTDVIKEAGGVPVMSPTGHSIVKSIMKDEQAELAGEMSGHLFFKDRWYGFDDAMYSACRLLEILSQSMDSIHQQFGRIPNSINTPEIKIPIDDHKKFDFMRELAEKADFSGADLITIDGLRVEFNHGWGLIRASNTTPCLVARFEAENIDALLEIKAIFKAQIHALDNTLNVPF